MHCDGEVCQILLVMHEDLFRIFTKPPLLLSPSSATSWPHSRIVSLPGIYRDACWMRFMRSPCVHFRPYSYSSHLVVNAQVYSAVDSTRSASDFLSEAYLQVSWISAMYNALLYFSIWRAVAELNLSGGLERIIVDVLDFFFEYISVEVWKLSLGGNCAHEVGAGVFLKVQRSQIVAKTFLILWLGGTLDTSGQSSTSWVTCLRKECCCFVKEVHLLILVISCKSIATPDFSMYFCVGAWLCTELSFSRSPDQIITELWKSVVGWKH